MQESQGKGKEHKQRNMRQKSGPTVETTKWDGKLRKIRKIEIKIMWQQNGKEREMQRMLESVERKCTFMNEFHHHVISCSNASFKQVKQLINIYTDSV